MPAILWQTIKDINLLRLDRRSGKLLRQAISDFQPDLIYERGFYMMCSGVKIAREKGIPHITEMNAPFLQEKESLEGKTLAIPLAAKREKIQSANTDMMVVVS